MNFEKNREEGCGLMMDLASVLLKRPVSCLSLLAPPLLHITGLRFLHILLTSAALLFSSFLFPISVPPPPVQSSKHGPHLDNVTTNHITGEIEYKPSKTNEEDGDGVIPDDESLIELSLPSGYYVGHHYASNKNNLYIHNKVHDFKIFDLFTELSDFVEEDNLIEIDISVGAIKYSRFEIKA